MANSAVIWWVRRSFRLEDNPVLAQALAFGHPVLAVYVHNPQEETPWERGGASNWWLHHTLKAFQATCLERGLTLHFAQGSAEEVLPQLAEKTAALAVVTDDLIEPALLSQAERVGHALGKTPLKRVNAALMFDHSLLMNKTGKPYQVFTPFSKLCFEQLVFPARPVCPAQLPSFEAVPELSLPIRWTALEALALLPRLNWADAFPATWTPGEAGAKARLANWVADAIDAYPDDRDRPDHEGVSRLSPHLHFGELSPFTVWQAVLDVQNARPHMAKAHHSFLRQLLWREFAHHLLLHYPHTPLEPLRDDFKAFPWTENPEALARWQRGETGIPIVDAGMRQLWTTGWMHNRVRMLVASYLTKNLLLPWQDGARWFWDTLVDADLSQNTLGWQWTAGCGADAAPYFRIFNPVLQAAKFDPKGDYIARWVPELKDVPVPYRFAPWETPAFAPRNYPAPLVDLHESRATALKAYDVVKLAKQGAVS